MGEEARQKGPPDRPRGVRAGAEPDDDAQRHLGHAQADHVVEHASHGRPQYAVGRAPTASEEEVADPKAGMDEAARDAAAAAEEMSAGDGDAPTSSSTPPAEEMVTTVEEPPLDPTQYQQLLLQQVTPLKTGVLRFPRTMKALGRYEATSPPPRHVIISRLPPGCSTEPRSDLQNFLLTTHIPLSGQGELTCGGETVAYEDAKPIVFDSTRQYSVKNTGSEDLLLLHVDFWHPAVTEDEMKNRCWPTSGCAFSRVAH